MKVVKNRDNLIIHKQRLNTKVQTQIHKLRYIGSRRHEEEGVTINFHDVLLLLGVVVQLLVYKVYLEL